jgi:hypothetical protein
MNKKVFAAIAIVVGMMAVSIADARPPRRRLPRRAVRRAVRRAPAVARRPALVRRRRIAYLPAPPRGHIVLKIGGLTYYRLGHIFYRSSRIDGRIVYVEVAPPIGAVVETVPETSERIVVNGRTYLREDSVYFVERNLPDENAMQYVVTPPPVGAVVDSLPSGAKTVTKEGTTYFVVDGAHFLPIHVEKKTKYVVVQQVGTPMAR